MKVKKVKYPKSLWVAFNGLMQPCDVGKVMCKGWYFGRKRYHLHPGNEVKLKRENAMMHGWLSMFIEACGKDKAWQEVMSEISRKMPDMFVKGTRK